MRDVRLAPAAGDAPDVRRLTAAQQAELRARYEGGQEPGTPPSAADVAVVPEGAGYRRIAAFGPYGDDADDSLFYERVLDRA